MLTSRFADLAQRSMDFDKVMTRKAMWIEAVLETDCAPTAPAVDFFDIAMGLPLLPSVCDVVPSAVTRAVSQCIDNHSPASPRT